MSRRIVVGAGFRLLLMLLAGADCAQATYSIVACDAKTRECGVAVETNNLAVGASVPYAQAGVGAVASQFETNPHYGPRGLALLAQGMSPAEAMKKILAEDGNFDGQGIAARQVGIVRASTGGLRVTPGKKRLARSGPVHVRARATAFRETGWLARVWLKRWSGRSWGVRDLWRRG
jgi:hypothetical protein